MRFVSCLPVSNDAVGQEEVEEVVLCESHFAQDDFPSSAEAINDLKVEWLVLSEGSEIHQRRECCLKNLEVFTDVSETKYIWYELLKHLTTHRVHYEDMEHKVKYTRWVCNAPEGGQWSICMEMESGGLVRKIAQLELTPASHCELNLFRMANELFQECCSCNDKMVGLKSQMDKIEQELKDLHEERKLLDQLLERRDAQTRSIVVGLLNEKKRKIRELEGQLKDHGPDDDEIINRHVTDPVRGHSSLGRRKRHVDNKSQNDTRRRPRPPPKKLHIKKQDSEPEPEPEPETQQKLRFLGIKKKQNPVKQEEDDFKNLSMSSTNESTNESTDGYTNESANEEDSTDEGQNVTENQEKKEEPQDGDGDEDDEEEETDLEQ